MIVPTHTHMHPPHTHKARAHTLSRSLSSLRRPPLPQIFVDGASIGGSDDLAAKLADGSFLQVLQSSSGKPALPAGLLKLAQEAQVRPERGKEGTRKYKEGPEKQVRGGGKLRRKAALCAALDPLSSLPPSPTAGDT
jgi:hypothetical protein